MTNPTLKNPGGAPPSPKCPYCQAQPVRYNIVMGFTPDEKYVIVQCSCADCDALLTALPAPLPPKEESPLGPRSAWGIAGPA